MTHLLQHTAQRRMIRMHDFRLMMLEAQSLERPLHAIGMAAARPHLLDAQLPLPHRRQYGVPPGFAFAVFPRRGQPTHASPRFPGAPRPALGPVPPPPPPRPPPPAAAP